MEFQRLGRAYHPVLRTLEDLREACDLDEALWVATSAPTHAFRMDPVFLELLDSDHDTRVKCGELKVAVAWTDALLSNPQAVKDRSTTLRAADLSPGAPDTGAVRKVLDALAGDDGTLPLDTIRDWRKQLEQQPVSEAGVILPDAAESDSQRADIEQVLAVMDGVDHPSGKEGLSKEVLDRFRTRVAERRDWLAQTGATDDLGRSVILPLAEHTQEAWNAYQAVRDPVEHFFRLCEAMELDPDSVDKSWPGFESGLDWRDGPAVREALRRAPLARPNPERILKLDRKLNPAWMPEMHALRQQVLVPLLDRTDGTVTLEVWDTVRDRLAPYGAWRAAEPHPELSSLSAQELEDWLSSGRLQGLKELCDRPPKTRFTLSEARTAEKLALYQGNLLTFANNFIAFPYLYEEVNRAAFEMGTLIMDGRRFNLAVRVPNRAEYLKSLTDGTMFIMIVEVENPERKEKFEIAVPATSGQQGNLRLGKHGVFEHVDGSQWFATVVHIQDNPISFAEAVFEPFKRLGQAVTKKVESLTQAAEKKLDATGGEAVTQLKEGAAPAPGAGGMLAGGGIAVAALGSSLAFITKIFSELQPAGVAKGLLAAILAVLIPGSILAWIRLSKRDLSVLLEGADWAVNSRMRLNSGQCRAFTQTPRFPKGSRLKRNREWWLWRILWILAAAALLVNLA